MKILLVRLRQIGDVVFTTPAIRALRQHFPDSHLSYLVEPSAAAIVAENPHLNEVIVAPRAGGLLGTLADLRLGARLRRERFDLVLDFHGGPRASLLTWLSRAPRRVGYDVKGRSWMYTDIVDRPRELRARHSVENQWDLLTRIGVPAPARDTAPVEMVVSTPARQRVRRRLVTSGVNPDDAVVVMHVSAGNPFRRWPLSSFGDVAARLVAGGERRWVVVTSGPSEAEAAAQVVADAQRQLNSDRRSRVVAWSDDFPLDDLRALVESAALYIGGDSGPMHVAATSRVPMVSLYGPTLPARSAPWRPQTERSAAVEVLGLDCRPCEQRVCVTGDFRCLGRIQPEAVVLAAERLLAKVH